VVDADAIAEMATLFKKTTSRPLTNYQKCMNKAAVEICLENPGMLRKRQALIDTARIKIIDEGFIFVKGHSRSNKSDEEPRPKRPKISQDVREKRMKDVEEDLADLKERISFKEKRIAEYINISDYKKCDELKEEVTILKKQQRELQAELKRLLVSDKKSKSYHRRLAAENESTCTYSDKSTPSPISASERGSDYSGGSVSPVASVLADYHTPRTPQSPDLIDYFAPSSPPVLREGPEIEIESTGESGYSEDNEGNPDEQNF
jgi:polyhydroxyalkanoate synthesis regulator phasin